MLCFSLAVADQIDKQTKSVTLSMGCFTLVVFNSSSGGVIHKTDCAEGLVNTIQTDLRCVLYVVALYCSSMCVFVYDDLL